MSPINDAMFENSLMFARSVGINSDTFKKYYEGVEGGNNKIIEYFCATIRKFSLAKLALNNLNSCKKMTDQINSEYHFNSGILLLSSTLDSFACLLNEIFGIGLSER